MGHSRLLTPEVGRTIRSRHIPLIEFWPPSLMRRWFRARPFVRQLSSAVVTLALARGVLSAQSPTGRIEGQIRDSAGSPLSEVQVFVVGTAFGALTDPRGHYFINHVPPATYDLRAAYVGYRPVTARDLRVLTGQTVTQDFALEAAPLVLRGIEVVGGSNPLVPRDEVTTTQRVQGDFSSSSCRSIG